jgi:hypothetical protein
MTYKKMTVMMGLATGVSSFGFLAMPAYAQQAPAAATSAADQQAPPMRSS